MYALLIKQMLVVTLKLNSAFLQSKKKTNLDVQYRFLDYEPWDDVIMLQGEYIMLHQLQDESCSGEVVSLTRIA